MVICGTNDPDNVSGEFAEEVKGLLDYNVGGIVGHGGDYLVLPSGTTNTTFANGGYHSGGAGGAGGGVQWVSNMPVNTGSIAPFPVTEGTWGGTYDDMEWVRKDVKLNKKTLTQVDIDKLVKTICMSFKKDETVIICVDEGTSSQQMSELATALRDYGGLTGFVMTKPAGLAKADTGKPRSEDDRVDILARIGVIWEQYPHLRLGQLMAMVLETDNNVLMEIEDYPLIGSLETSYGAK
jgi:hypothetical protein